VCVCMTSRRKSENGVLIRYEARRFCFGYRVTYNDERLKPVKLAINLRNIAECIHLYKRPFPYSKIIGRASFLRYDCNTCYSIVSEIRVGGAPKYVCVRAVNIIVTRSFYDVTRPKSYSF